MSFAKILVVEDDAELQEALVDTLMLNGFEVLGVSCAEAALVALDDDIGMVFSDIRMDGMDGYTLMQRIRAIKPYLPIVLMTAYGTIEQAVSAMKAGAVDYIVKPFEAKVLVEKANVYFNRDASSEDDFVVADSVTQQLKTMAKKVAQSDASILISGDSGTGKEVLARYIHNQSPRAKQPFVAINCAAIPENMLEAMLFGYEKGSFTGAAKAMPGKFEQAQNGTLFLDEIGEMKADLQAKLLRVLQEKEVERIGGLKLIQLDVRILSASNIEFLFNRCKQGPQQWQIDLANQEILLGNNAAVGFAMDQDVKQRLLSGLDFIGASETLSPQIGQYEAARKQATPWLG